MAGTVKVTINVDTSRVRRAMERLHEEIEQLGRRTYRAGLRARMMRLAWRGEPSWITLYAICRTKIDPMVPLRYKSARRSLAEAGWFVDVGLYEPVFVGIEELV